MRYTDEHSYTSEDVQVLSMIISGRIADARRERTYYLIGVAILTPFLIAASLFIFFMCLCGQMGQSAGGLTLSEIPVVAAALLSLMWVILLANQMLRFKVHGADMESLGRSFFGMTMLGLLAGLPFHQSWPTVYCLLFGAILVIVLGLMGRGYDARFRVANNGDAAHTENSLVVCSAVPAMLIGLYVTLQEQSWLKRGLDRDELLAAALLLFAAACRNTRREDAILRAIGRERAERVTDALLRLELVERRSLHHILTTDSEKLIQSTGALAWC